MGGSLYLEPYEVRIPKPGVLKIGCQIHSIDAWEDFTDSEISAMDRATARKFWAQWKAPLLKWARAANERGALTDGDDSEE